MKAPEGIVRAAYAALEQAAERLVITDRQGTIIYVNPAFERVTGFTREEAVGQNPRIVKSGLHDQRFYAQLWEALLSGKTFQARFVNRKKTGELFYEEQTISPLKSEEGKISYFISTAVDVRPRVQEREARECAEESLDFLRRETLSREGRVLELKHEVNALLLELGRPAKYADGGA